MELKIELKWVYVADAIAIFIAIIFLGVVIHLLSIEELSPIGAQALLHGALFVSICYILLRYLIGIDTNET